MKSLHITITELRLVTWFIQGCFYLFTGLVWLRRKDKHTVDIASFCYPDFSHLIFASILGKCIWLSSALPLNKTINGPCASSLCWLQKLSKVYPSLGYKPQQQRSWLASSCLGGQKEAVRTGAPEDSRTLFSSGWGLLCLCCTCGSPARLSQGRTSGIQRDGVSGLGAEEEQSFCSGCVLYRSEPSDCCLFTKGVGAGWKQQTAKNCGLKQKHLWNHAKFVYIF